MHLRARIQLTPRGEPMPLGFKRTETGWDVGDTPAVIGLTLTEICTADNRAIHAEGNAIVIANQVWYDLVGYDVEQQKLVFRRGRDDRWL
jgi:hypothetical protein